MAISAVGLQTHIWNNRLASGFLLICYPLILLTLLFAACAVLGWREDLGFSAANTWYYFKHAAPYVIIFVLIWYVIATLLHQRIINKVTRAKGVTRDEEPHLYKMLETLCISRGMPMPHLAIIETDQLNAFASGLTPESAQITLTTGLINELSDEELEAVLAHELSHVIHGDIALLVISSVFVGLIGFLCESSWRFLGSGSSDKGASALIFFMVIISSLGYLLSILLRFALSRRREYLADAGAVDITKNPNAMVSALAIISGRSAMPDVPSDFKEMMIDYPRQGFFGMFSTHPPIEHRIAALREYASATHDITAAYIKPKRSPWEKRLDIWR